MAKIYLRSKLQNLAMKKKDAYVTRPVYYARITGDELLERAADNSKLRKSEIYLAAEAITREFRNFLQNGHAVTIPEIGTFRFGFRAHATDTLAEAGAAQVYRRRIIYLPCMDLRRQLNTVTLEDVTVKDEEGGEEP